ncbi:MAG TPA: alpha/beta hydrolase [Ohtaekwangia sp.]|uniref:alpha/beta hydrolase n=1 Tax=Ohtaekwangia sp. TaxID=2066019 RepID=UPI002F94C3A7
MSRLQTFSGTFFGSILFSFVLVCSCTVTSLGQQVPINTGIDIKTYTFATKDSLELQLDVYRHADAPDKSPCVLFVFGGGFIRGRRDAPIYNPYFNTLAQSKYVVVSMSYRLGLVGAKRVTPFRTWPLRKAINMAVEDIYDATNWILKSASTIGIDPSLIILSGSSAGAISALQADFEKRNNKPVAKVLPSDFQYAGIIAFAGAILTFDGALTYKVPPAPTMLFHGTDDKLVIYKKIRLFNKAFYGSSHIAKVFNKKKYPYYIYREVGMGHEVSFLPLSENSKEILWFIQEYILNKKPYLIDMSFDNLNKVRTMNLTPNDLYRKR